MAGARVDLSGAWLKALLFVLLGYVLLGKGFAYLFLGEMLIAIGCIMFLMALRPMLIFSDSVLLLWAIFALWGVCRTVPFLGQYRFEAVRDAALWGYGLVALLIVAFVNRSTQISKALNAYRKFLRWFLPVVPFLLIASVTIATSLPDIPWSNGVSILHLKGGDEGVNLAAAGLFLLIFPDQRSASGKHEFKIHRMFAFVGWWMALLVVMILNRGGTVALIVSIVFVAVLRARQLVGKIAVLAILGVILAGFLFLAVPANLHVGARTLNSSKLVATIGSIAGGSAEGTGHENTAKWRLLWWRNIVRETFYGPYFWTGRGFGVNLAVVDGPLGAKSEEDVALRSPHNGSMTVLARMGVPGFVIWLALNLTFVARMFMAQRLATRSRWRFWSRLDLWILSCWLATFINMTFDVYIEGPQGGIWFWSIIGFGVAALRVQAYEARHLLTRSRTEEFEALGSEAPLVPA
jgi:hypothetical protein